MAINEDPFVYIKTLKHSSCVSSAVIYCKLLMSCCNGWLDSCSHSDRALADGPQHYVVGLPAEKTTGLSARV